VTRNDQDLALVRRCVAGEPGAWREFVDSFGPTVRALARRYLKLHGRNPDSSELDDVAQEVFLAVTRRDYRLLRNYDPTYTFKTYLGVITRTEVHRVLRKRRPFIADNPTLEAAAGSETPQDVERAEEGEALHRALAALPERDAKILKLRFLRELDYRAIADRLEIPEASVGQTLFRAKQRLLQKLKGILSILV